MLCGKKPGAVVIAAGGMESVTVRGGLSEKTEYCETGGAREVAKESQVRGDLEQRESKPGRVSLFSLLYPGRAPFSCAPICRALTPPDARQGCLLPLT